MRYYQGKPVELLAPAGNYEILDAVVMTSCDAVYFGGQVFNMRLIRKGFNFTHEELIRAVKRIHEMNKSAYITVNNLINEEELSELDDYLNFLAYEVKPDAIIVQDMGIVKRISELGLPLEIHSSVMMNVHNLQMIETLKTAGIKRVVLSREATLDTVKQIKAATEIEIEYFTHGDMCIAHGSQCYYSSHIFGMSSNQGRCLKPCRWWFKKQPEGELSFPMAVKDLSLIEYIPQMLEAGVTSFKLEGRMREKEFIVELIEAYAQVFDTYIDHYLTHAADQEKAFSFEVTQNDEEKVSKFEQQVKESSKWIFEHRKRDLSTGYAFGNPGLDNINSRYEGTGKFYSTGKMFSTPTEETEITEELRQKVQTVLKTYSSKKDDNISLFSLCHDLPLSVKVQNSEQALIALNAHVSRIYLTMDRYRPLAQWTSEQIEALKKIRDKYAQEGYCYTELYMVTPRMSVDPILSDSYEFLSTLKPSIDGIMITQLGEICRLKTLELPLVGDFCLNLCNRHAVEFYRKQGLSGFTPSIELKGNELGALLYGCNTSEIKKEMIVYGQLPVMYYDHAFEEDRLYNEAGVFELVSDCNGRTHMLSHKPVNYTMLTDELQDLGVSLFRIEANSMDENELRYVLEHLNQLQNGSFGAVQFS